MPTILVTGGAGYIGSHTCVELLGAGYEVVVIDNFCNSKPEALRRVEAIAGRKLLAFHNADVRDRAALRELFKAHAIDAVIHFAALKAVGESVAKPLMYYDNNIAGTVALTEVMGEAGVKSLVFSSSATVYGDPASVPIREDFPTGPTNPYGRTKWMMEFVLSDLAGGAAALLQPGGGACQRAHRRGSERAAQQSDALREPGGGGAPAAAACVRW